MTRLTRREVLRLGLLGAGGMALGALATACGRAPNVLTAPTLGGLISARKAAGASQTLSVFLGGQDYVDSGDNYLVFFLAQNRANGPRIFGDDTRVWLAPTLDPAAKVTPVGPTPGRWFAYTHPDGGPPLPQGVNAATVQFPSAGIYTLVVETTTGGRVLGTTAVQVKAKGHTDTRIPGDPALASQTPTVSDHRGVEPICTRKPPCDMHQITLAEAMANGKPTAFFVGTPEFCMSRNCGPSLNELIAVENALRGQANFVHAEVYLNDQTQTIEQQIPSPTFQQWGFTSEPWLFLIDRNGIIASRLEGGFSAGQARAALQPLLGS